MGTTIAFTTPTLMDTMSFTMMGLNVKPNSTNPIGYFGTGLKYAVATLLRHGLRVQLFIGLTEYEFVIEQDTFRDKAFNFISLRKRRGVTKNWTRTRLPFTTELGKNWELWQAYRELYTNTVDEGGVIYETDTRAAGIANTTCIFVTGDEFVQEHIGRKHTFLLDDNGNIRNGGSTHERTADIEVIQQPSKHIYWRGMRVYDLPEDQRALYTYNILKPLRLTEDRTILYQFELNDTICDYVKSLDKHSERLIHNIVTAEKGTFEHNLRFNESYATASSAFKEVITKVQSRTGHGSRRYSLSPSASYFYGTYIRPEQELKANQEVVKRRIEVAEKLIDAIKGTDFGNFPFILIEHQEMCDDLVAVIEKGKEFFEEQIIA